ncbi:MAG: hypothetical protein JSV96_00090 [Candidatus Aminicenantes bacterium]|nr:MAG: hypothetical protein JSV96_00090 [Candidatus Aminicenantes bacterium]
MKILHIWNTTASGSTISKFMNRIYKTHSWVITRRQFDLYGHTTYGETSKLGAKLFTLKTILKAMNYDIIHVHAFDKIIPYLKLIYPNKKILLHYRGTDIRGKWDSRIKYWSKADIVFVSTEDLLEDAPSGTIYIPRAVDTDFFYPRGISNYGTAFHVSYKADDLAIKYAKENNLSLTIHDRLKNPIQYQKFGEILSEYEYYIDVKRDNEGRVLDAMSKTGLESLACGLKVIRWDGKVVKELPIRNLPENVVKKLFNIYLEILN